MGFSRPPAAAATPPVYNAPNLAPLLDFYVANLPADTFGKLPSPTTATFCHYLPLVGDKALFSPINNITSTVRLLQLTDFSQYALAPSPANCGGSMPTEPVSGQFIYMPQGFSASGVRGSAFYRYNIHTDAWSTMTAITSLNAFYRFSYPNAAVWDGGDFVYVFGAYDAVADRATFRYSIAGNSWVELAANPDGGYAPAASGVLQGDFIYLVSNGFTTRFRRYSISGNSFANMANVPFSCTYASLVQATDDTDKLYLFGGAAATPGGALYSISGDSWTTLTATNIPVNDFCKGIYLTSPVNLVLLPRRGFSQLWVYKV